VIVGDVLSLLVLPAGCGVPNDPSVTVSVSGVWSGVAEESPNDGKIWSLT
jgi:hypothetical protein